MERRQDIGKAVREKMEGLHRSPGDALWQSIDATLTKKKRRKTFLWWSLAGGALLTAVVLFSLLPRTANPVPTGIRAGSGEKIDHQSKNQRPEAPSGSLSGTKPVTDESSQAVSDRQAAGPEQSGTANQNVSVSKKETQSKKASTKSPTEGRKIPEIGESNTGRPTTDHKATVSSNTISPVNGDKPKANENRKSTGGDSKAGANHSQNPLTNPDSNAGSQTPLVKTEKQRSNLLVKEENNTATANSVKNGTSVISDTGGQIGSGRAATVPGSTGYDDDRNGSSAEGTHDKSRAATDTSPTPPRSGPTSLDKEQPLTGKDSITTGGNSNTTSTAGGLHKLPGSSTIESTEAATMPKDSVGITSETGKGTSKEVTLGEISGYKGIFIYAHLDAGKYKKSSNGSLLDSSLNRNSTSTDFPLQYGIYAGYHISDRWSVRTGITKKEITSTTRNVDFNPDWTPNNPYFANISYPEQVTNLTLTNQFGQRGYTIEHKAQYLEVPAEVLYKILQGKFGLQATGGIGILLVQENNVTARHELGSMYLGKLRTMQNASVSYNFGVSAYYELLPGLQVNTEPVVRYYPGAIEGHKFYTLGVQAGLQYTFGSVRKN